MNSCPCVVVIDVPYTWSMCLIAIAWQTHPDFPLVVAANRDEWRARPTEPLGWWHDVPGLLAGRDVKAGGTWMGVTHEGRFAAVTNFRDPSDARDNALSRGKLVTDFLRDTDPPEAFFARLAGRASQYNGFNLIGGDRTSLFYLGSREARVRAIAPGVHGLSNHTLDEPWPKVRRARVAMESALRDPDPTVHLFAMLADTAIAPDDELPDTGVGLEWERRLSPPLITGEAYGSRTSSVLTVARDGAIFFEERTLDADGKVTTSNVVRFEVAPP
ncbi:NRDE family protein [Pendulispora rubella]|uniref:NRDE family protein n=1 Tax=Pendulispora rubella TaxID=2741070 RepID=A0ABZ2LID2_9BACT